MTFYNLFRDEAEHHPRLGDAKYPGLPNMGEPATVYVRDAGQSWVEVGGDTVQRRVYWLMPEVSVGVGDTIDGHKVTEVAEAKDHAGNRLYWIAYAEA